MAKNSTKGNGKVKSNIVYKSQCWEADRLHLNIQLTNLDCDCCGVLQDMWAETGLDDGRQEHLHVDSGSGMETSGDCDDEDGCEGSGEDEEEIGVF